MKINKKVNTMRKKTLGWGLLAILVLGYISAQEAEKGSIDWITEYPKGAELAGKLDKPLLIFFYAPWSQPSTMMLKNVWETPEVVESSGRFVCVSINVDTHHYDTQFKVKTFPTLIFTDPSGHEIFRRSGFIPAKELSSLMKVFPTNFAIINDLKKKIEINKEDAETLHRIAQLYSQMRAWDVSSDYYKQVLKLKDLNLDEGLKDVVVYGLAINQIMLRQYEEAEKALEEELKEYPKGKSTEKIHYALFVAKIGQRKISEAEKEYKKLKSKYPDSHYTKQAEMILESMKTQKKLIVVEKKDNN